MGHVKVRARIWNIEDSSKSREVELVADTGATYTVLPASLLRELGVKPIGKRKFRLCQQSGHREGHRHSWIELAGRIAHTIAVFGDENVYLLGVVTLEELGLEVDPVKGELRPMELLLYPSYRST